MLFLPTNTRRLTMRTICFLALLLAVLSPVAGATTTTYTGEAVVRSFGETRVAVFLDTNGDRLVTMIGSALMHSTGDSGCDIQRAHEKDAGACYAYGKK